MYYVDSPASGNQQYLLESMNCLKQVFKLKVKLRDKSFCVYLDSW